MFNYLPCPIPIIFIIQSYSFVVFEAPISPQKVCNENESRIRKNDAHIKMLFIKETLFNSQQKTGENDLHKLQGNNCGYNKGTICLVNE